MLEEAAKGGDPGSQVGEGLPLPGVLISHRLMSNSHKDSKLLLKVYFTWAVLNFQMLVWIDLGLVALEALCHPSATLHICL